MKQQCVFNNYLISYLFCNFKQTLKGPHRVHIIRNWSGITLFSSVEFKYLHALKIKENNFGKLKGKKLI